MVPHYSLAMDESLDALSDLLNRGCVELAILVDGALHALLDDALLILWPDVGVNQPLTLLVDQDHPGDVLLVARGSLGLKTKS